MKKREADFSLRFRHWIRANPPRVTCHFEVKQTTHNSIPFTCIEEAQTEYGMALEHGVKGVLMRNMSGNGEPDYTYSFRDPVFIVIKYPACFCIISLQRFIYESKLSKRKSLTTQRARDIAQQVVEL